MADLIENCRVMIGLLTVLGALLLGARAQQHELNEFRLVGSDVTLVPKYTGDLKEIKWILDDRILVEIILKPQEEFIHPLTNDRATINKTNGALTIRNLDRGDFGDYKAQAVANSIEYTEIRLAVRDCPYQPTISVQSTEDWFVVSCKSFSPGVTYNFLSQARSVIKKTYVRPKKNGTLTCVLDNKVCNKNSSINFYTPDPSGLSGWIIALIIIIVIPLIYIIAIAVLYYFRENDLAKYIFSVLTCGKKQFVERLIGRVIGFFCKSKNKGAYQWKCQQTNQPLI